LAISATKKRKWYIHFLINYLRFVEDEKMIAISDNFSVIYIYIYILGGSFRYSIIYIFFMEKYLIFTPQLPPYFSFHSRTQIVHKSTPTIVDSQSIRSTQIVWWGYMPKKLIWVFWFYINTIQKQRYWPETLLILLNGKIVFGKREMYTKRFDKSS
jgi:hypothetical protein